MKIKNTFKIVMLCASMLSAMLTAPIISHNIALADDDFISFEDDTSNATTVATTETETLPNYDAISFEDDTTAPTEAPTTTAVTTTTTTVTTTTTYAVNSEAEKAIELINKYREENGCKDLIESASINELADVRVSEINSLTSHYRPNSKLFHTIFSDYGISIKYVGETIATGTDDISSAEDVVNKWISSEEDSKVLLGGNYEYIGLSFSQSTTDSTKYNWVLLVAGDSQYLKQESTANNTRGDINGDGKINSADAVIVLKTYANTLAKVQLYSTKSFLARADVDQNSKIESKDAIKILIYYAKCLTGATAEL